VIFPHLDERQRRLLMGAEARALKVRAELDTSQYATGVQVTGAQMKALPLERHEAVRTCPAGMQP
jgi:hypothetical protein